MCKSLRPEFSFRGFCLVGDGGVYREEPETTHILTLFSHQSNFWCVLTSNFNTGRSGGDGYFLFFFSYAFSIVFSSFSSFR